MENRPRCWLNKSKIVELNISDKDIRDIKKGAVVVWLCYNNKQELQIRCGYSNARFPDNTLEKQIKVWRESQKSTEKRYNTNLKK